MAKGADPNAKVDKIEFYRELDKHKQSTTLLNQARDIEMVKKK